MSDTVTLKHALHTLPVRREPFYDGHGVAYDGLITLPIANISHVRAAFFRGYNHTPEGERLVTFQDLDAYIERVAAPKPAPQTAKSAKETTDESTDNRGQSTDTDRVRPRKRKSRTKTSQ